MLDVLLRQVRELSQIEDAKQAREHDYGNPNGNPNGSPRGPRGWQPSSWGRRARTPRQPRARAETPTKHINPAIMAKLQIMNLQDDAGVSTESG